MFSSLKIKNFRIYWLGMTVSLIGTWAQTIAQSWLIFQLTNSAFLLGVVAFLGVFPVFLFSLIGGVVADRVNKRNVILLTQFAFMLLTFLLAGLTQLKVILPWHIMVIAVLNGIVMAFDAPARQAVVVELTGKTYLMNAIALNSVSFNASRIIGPALAGIFISTIGMAGCFYLNGFSFLAVLFALLYIQIPGNNLKPPANNSALRDLKDGLKFVMGNKLILSMMSMVGISSLFGVSYTMLMPIFAQDVLHIGVKGLGLLMSSTGVGALLAALLLARMGDFRYKGRLLIFSCVVFSLALILFSLSKTYLVSIFALIFIGGASVMAIALINTMLQTMTTDELRGRVMSVFMLTFAGLMPFGNLIAGSVSHVFGVSLTVLLSGIACLGLFMAVSFITPELAKL